MGETTGRAMANGILLSFYSHFLVIFFHFRSLSHGHAGGTAVAISFLRDLVPPSSHSCISIFISWRPPRHSPGAPVSVKAITSNLLVQTIYPPMVLLHSCHARDDMQIEEMYSVPESFLEIEVRNPQTHGEFI